MSQAEQLDVLLDLEPEAGYAKAIKWAYQALKDMQFPDNHILCLLKGCKEAIKAYYSNTDPSHDLTLMLIDGLYGAVYPYELLIDLGTGKPVILHTDYRITVTVFLNMPNRQSLS